MFISPPRGFRNEEPRSRSAAGQERLSPGSVTIKMQERGEDTTSDVIGHPLRVRSDMSTPTPGELNINCLLKDRGWVFISLLIVIP